MMSVLQFDPVIVRFLAERELFQQFVRRLYAGLPVTPIRWDAFRQRCCREPSPPASASTGYRHRRRHCAPT
jgi:hypothetical protein